jgi:hypothetical protein
MAINNVIGRPVSGEDFFNRISELGRIWARIQHNNILLLAPRRVGKTSLLRRLESDGGRGFEAVYVSVAGFGSEIEFISRLYEAVASRARGAQAVRSALGRVWARLPRLGKLEVPVVFKAEFLAPAAQDWRVLGEELLGVLRTTEQRWLFLVDELPLFVMELLRESRSRARSFLTWFRECRTDQKVDDSARWLLSGSIGLDTLAVRERFTDTINDLASEVLGPFSADDADRFLVALAESHEIQLSPEVRTRILVKVGWLIPYHLQLLFSTLVDRKVTTPRILDVDEGYQRLLEPAHKNSFDWWQQRLVDELGQPDAAHALAVLAAVARDDGGASRGVISELLASRGVLDDQHRRFLLDALESDGYLVVNDGDYQFRSPLLRDYWCARVLSP